MRLEYRLGYLDYLLFSIVHQALNVRLQVVYIALPAFIAWEEWKPDQPAFAIAYGVIVYAAMWLVQIVFTAVYIASRRSDGVLTEHVIELRDDAFYESTKFNESKFFWPGIQRVVRRPGFVAVYVAQHMAHVIPMRAFESSQQAADFIRFIREKMDAK